MSEQDKTAEEKYLYLYAEFENFKKRIERDQSDFLKFGHERMLKELLSVQDNLEKAVEHSKDPGVGMILAQLSKILSNAGVVGLLADGEQFNPEFHEALLEEESDKEKGTVLKELEKGYLLFHRLLRPAKVVVAK